MRIEVREDWVRLESHLGDDRAIVRAARNSYGTGTKSVSDDQTLINYLVRHRHTTPLEFVEFVFQVRVPMDCWRQWIRHRTASVNEYSTRYSVAIDEFAATKPSEWRTQAADRKQGSGNYLPAQQGATLTCQEAELHDLARRTYSARLDAGVAREQARKDLPLSTYTMAYWKIDLHNLLHFLGLRMAPDAQQEIREYAEAIAKLIQPIVPMTWAAFERYRLRAITLSALDQEVVRTGRLDLIENARERRECLDKLSRLGLCRDPLVVFGSQTWGELAG